MWFATLSSSCSNFVVHDEGRAAIASAVKKAYADTKVTDVFDTEQKNLQTLLSEEIQAVRDNYALQTDFAMLGIANNATPMASTYVEAMQRLNELGYASPKEVRGSRDQSAKMAEANRRIGTVRKVFAGFKTSLPDCSVLKPDLEFPKDMGEANRLLLKKQYEVYKTQCQIVSAGNYPTSGKIGQAYLDWSTANELHQKLLADQAQVVKELQAAKAAFDEKSKAATQPVADAKAFAEKYAEESRRLADALTKARALGGGLENSANITAIVELLTAASGTSVDKSDPRIVHAAAVVSRIPAFANDAGAIGALRQAPPVSGLLIALRQQTLLADAAQKRALLEEERIGILKEKLDAYAEESNRWLKVTDAMCSYAALSSDMKHPADACDGFDTDKDGNCVLAGQSIAKCILATSWKARFADSDKPDARRELYKAVTGYMQALSFEGIPVEDSFKEIDVRHRQTLLAREAALEAWDSLVSVPLDQIDAYYQAGVKPAEIADLVVKALGFTAVAIGASK
jgi:hypothetical protein